MKIFPFAILAVCFVAPPLFAIEPIHVTGFNQDIVIDASASPGPAPDAITASMGRGAISKNDWTFYEKGFVPAAPTTGLPSGTEISSASGNGVFLLVPANGNNVLLLDGFTPSTLTFATPAPFGRLAFYDTTSNGASTVTFTIHYAGGSTQTGSFTSPDWYNGSPVAFNASGRANAVLGFTGDVGSSNPRIYEQIVYLTNSTANVLSVDFSVPTSVRNTAIFAISGDAIPEPGSVALLAAGGFWCLVGRRRRG